MERSYRNANGKYQEFADAALDKGPSIGYTSNPHMNLLLAMSHIYYDVYNHGGGNIQDRYLGHFKTHVAPFLPDIDIDDFIYGRAEKCEAAMDRVFEYLLNKSLDYPSLSVWMSYSNKYLSREEPLNKPEGEWNKVTFGLQKELESWYSDMESFGEYKDVTEAVRQTNARNVIVV